MSDNPAPSLAQKPCKSCQLTKSRCSYERPLCEQCVHRWNSSAKEHCVYEPVVMAKKKRYHEKSKDGCLVCRERRVKCDTAKPVCENCATRGKACVYKPGNRPLNEPVGRTEQRGAYANIGQSLEAVHPAVDLDFKAATPPVLELTVDRRDCETMSSFSRPRGSWLQKLLDSSRQRSASLLDLTGMSVEDPYQSLPLLRELNPFDLSSLFPQLSRLSDITTLSRTPLSQVFWPYIKLENRSVVPRSGEIDEQLHLVNHFLGETVHHMICIKVLHETTSENGEPLPWAGAIYNPWLQIILPVLFAAPPTDMTESSAGSTATALEALRNAIYSYASVDIGFCRSACVETACIGTGYDNNLGPISMRTSSSDYRRKALELLSIGRRMSRGIEFEAIPSQAHSLALMGQDIALMAGLLLCVRDRAAADTDWETTTSFTVDAALTIINRCDFPFGSSTLNHLSRNQWSSQRCFLIDQAVCTEMIACMTSYQSPKLIKYASHENFLCPRPFDRGLDHVEICFGIDRSLVNLFCRASLGSSNFAMHSTADRVYASLQLAAFVDYGRDLTVAAMVASAHVANLPSLADELEAKLADFMIKTDAFLQEIEHSRQQTMTIPHHPRTKFGKLCFLSVPAILIRSEFKLIPWDNQEMQREIASLRECIAEAMSNEYFKGLLWPTVWAATFSSETQYQADADRLLLLLQPHYRGEGRVATCLVALGRMLRVHKTHRSWTSEQKAAQCFLPLF